MNIETNQIEQQKNYSCQQEARLEGGRVGRLRLACVELEVEARRCWARSGSKVASGLVREVGCAGGEAGLRRLRRELGLAQHGLCAGVLVGDDGPWWVTLGCVGASARPSCWLGWRSGQTGMPLFSLGWSKQLEITPCTLKESEERRPPILLGFDPSLRLGDNPLKRLGFT
ncbi:unnamed protein product [Prunus armeniaca]